MVISAQSLFRCVSVVGKAARKACILASTQLLAATLFSATLVWHANTDSLTAGYRVFVRSGLELSEFDTGTKTNLLLDFTKPGKTYFFHVVAYSSKGIESDPSSTIEHLEPIPFGWPTLLAQPRPVAVWEGASALFVVQTTGFGSRYQWLKDGQDIPGATNIFLFIPSVSPARVGQYSVRLANDLGAIESDAAALSLLSLPTIVSQDRLLRVRAGDSMFLSVEGAGTPPLTYRWMKGSQIVQEGSDAQLLVLNASLADAGSYTVLVSNELASVSADPIEVFVEQVQPPDVRIERSSEALVLVIRGYSLSSYVVETLSALDGSDWIPFGEIDTDEEGNAALTLTGSDATIQFFRVFEF